MNNPQYFTSLSVDITQFWQVTTWVPWPHIRHTDLSRWTHFLFHIRCSFACVPEPPRAILDMAQQPANSAGDLPRYCWPSFHEQRYLRASWSVGWRWIFQINHDIPNAVPVRSLTTVRQRKAEKRNNSWLCALRLRFRLGLYIQWHDRSDRTWPISSGISNLSYDCDFLWIISRMNSRVEEGRVGAIVPWYLGE